MKRTLGSAGIGALAGLLLTASMVAPVAALTGTLVVHGPPGGGNTFPNPPFPGCNSAVSNGGWLTLDSPAPPSPFMQNFLVDGTAPLGSGSLDQTIIGGGGAAQALLFTSFGGAPLALLASFLNPAATAYGLKPGTATGAEAVAIVFVSYDGGVTIGDQLQFIPAVNGCFVPGSWTSCTFLGGMFKTSVAGPGNPHDPTGAGGFFTLAAYLAHPANATATVPLSTSSNPTLGIVTSGAPGVTADLDNFLFVSAGPPLSGPFTTLNWDFEADCTNYGGDTDSDCYCDTLNPLVANRDKCAGVSNSLCTGAGTPTDCCTGAGTGTCDSQTDTDADGIGDICDNCPTLGNGSCIGAGNPAACCTGAGTGTCADQTDLDGDDVGDVCDAALCPPTPGACLTAATNRIQIKDDTDPARQKFTWLWKLGTLSSVQADFGDPVAGSPQYSFCVYDETAGTPDLVMEATINAGGTCDGKPCWSPTARDLGWSYKNKLGNGDGIKTVRFTSGDAGKSKLKITGKGSSLPLPVPFGPTETFDLDTEVTVQLHTTVPGTCWQSTFSSASKNDGTQFKAP